jgi:arabinan endo-1,5-alpha-L-arabinosidase
MMFATVLIAMLATFQSLTATTPSDSSAFPGDGASASENQYAHDPTIIQVGKKYFCFSTGSFEGHMLRESTDLRTWKDLGSIFPHTPEWLTKRYTHRSIWAPDAVLLGKTLRSYYCASNFGTNQSVIGMAECANFDPDQPTKGWVDKGLVVESRPGADVFNAIDPEVIVDPDGRHWMFFGSYFGGIYTIELDPLTGLLKSPANPEPILVARNMGERGNPLEGAAICRREGYYYLFVSYGLAAQGVRSTYRVMVGRSKVVTGPFVDAKGVTMVDGGHVNVLKTSPPMFSPGHSDVFQDKSGRWLMPYHFYDGRHYWVDGKWGRPTLQVRELLWSEDGWPLPGLPVEYDIPSHKSGHLEGKWIHQVDFSEPAAIEINRNGEVRNGKQVGRWEQKGDHLTLRWPKTEPPGEFWIDELQIAYDGRYYVGRNQAGDVIRGIRSH